MILLMISTSVLSKYVRRKYILIQRPFKLSEVKDFAILNGMIILLSSTTEMWVLLYISLSLQGHTHIKSIWLMISMFI